MKKIEVIWVPGTSNHTVNPAFKKAIHRPVTLVNYDASWRLPSSTSDGYQKLTVAILKAWRNHHRIYLAGESQGALLISRAINDPNLSGIIDRALLFGNPGIAPKHSERDRNVKVINHPYDPATFDWGDEEHVMKAIDRLIYEHDLSQLGFFLFVILTHPVQTAIAGYMSLRHVSILAPFIPAVHDYSNDMEAGVQWLMKSDVQPHNG